jgi:hypothetical protein
MSLSRKKFPAIAPALDLFVVATSLLWFEKGVNGAPGVRQSKLSAPRLRRISRAHGVAAPNIYGWLGKYSIITG